MDLFEVIAKRRSVRKFKSDKVVGDDVVQRILDAAILAPSAGNGQSWHFEVVRDAKIKHRLSTEAGHQLFINQAPVVFVVCADLERAEKGYGTRGRDTYVLQETAAAVQNILLSATALDLGACWIGAFDEKAAAKILDLPSKLRPVAMVPVGVPDEPSNRVPPRRRIEDVTSYK